MKKYLNIWLIMFLLCACSKGFSQYKIVFVKSEDRYLRYYYNRDQSIEKINDSVVYRMMRVDSLRFQLAKIENSHCKWEKLFAIIYPRKVTNTIMMVQDKYGKSSAVNQRNYFYDTMEVTKNQ